MSEHPERVIIQPPPVSRHDPKEGTCFAIMHPLHGESFPRYFPDVATFRRLRDNHFTRTYVALEVAELEAAVAQELKRHPLQHQRRYT